MTPIMCLLLLLHVAQANEHGSTAVQWFQYTVRCMQGMCDGPPPADFILREPLPPGACAVRVREDFLDAPSGTTCLLIDSLYVLVAPRDGATTLSTLILHVRSPSRPCMCFMCSTLESSQQPLPSPPDIQSNLQVRQKKKPALLMCVG